MTTIQLPTHSVYLRSLNGDQILGRIHKRPSEDERSSPEIDEYRMILADSGKDVGYVMLQARESDAEVSSANSLISKLAASMAPSEAQPPERKPWLFVIGILNKTTYAEFGFKEKISRIGKALMEHGVKLALSWDNPFQGRICLLSVPRRLFFYWSLGFRPHPDGEKRVALNLLKIDRKKKENQSLEDEESTLYNRTITLISQARSLPASAFTPELLRTITLTEVMEQLYKTAVNQKQVDGAFLGEQYFYLPPKTQQMWKERILTAPLVVHEPRFLNQLLFEKVGQAPARVRDCVLGYCGEAAP